MKKLTKSIIVFLLEAIAGVLIMSAVCVLLLSSCEPPPEGYCGDDIIDPGEECDGYDHPAGITCETEGYCGGRIMCRDDCTLSLGNCELFPCSDPNGAPDSGEEVLP